ncbi:MAG TPA: CcoQ/FixQ family Cbb3-type cytochrome c oxidase assembly chaperone [Noviherbaspirillum sp.]|jgi:cytochrome c oxidase cbb3-type subunit 4|uniref:cbb3-type cytochrome oxidase subunit 3 n=1 Tax=Noviherbaspirillum sp. TaxID=1926288 RepID=UPI002F92D3C2
MDIEHFILDARTVVTVLSFLSFIGIVLWAYSGRRGAAFEAAARLPFADDMERREADEHHG